MGKLLEKFLFKMKKFRKFFWFLLLTDEWKEKWKFTLQGSQVNIKLNFVESSIYNKYSSVQYLRNIKTPDSSIHNIIEYFYLYIDVYIFTVMSCFSKPSQVSYKKINFPFFIPTSSSYRKFIFSFFLRSQL